LVTDYFEYHGTRGDKPWEMWTAQVRFLPPGTLPGPVHSAGWRVTKWLLGECHQDVSARELQPPRCFQVWLADWLVINFLTVRNRKTGRFPRPVSLLAPWRARRPVRRAKRPILALQLNASINLTAMPILLCRSSDKHVPLVFLRRSGFCSFYSINVHFQITLHENVIYCG
jgi:hypothetical protein